MAYDDKEKNGTIFPVRTGVATGGANERQMLDVLSGSQNIRTELRDNLDGSQTMLRTRGGFPEFSTNHTVGTPTDICFIAMDTGVVDMLDVGDGQPLQKSSGKVYRTTYMQTQASVGSVATGFGKISPPMVTGKVVADGADSVGFNIKRSGTDLVDKKKLAWRLPPSLFTGRARMYVQALYGGNNPFISLSDASGGIGRPVLGINTKQRDADDLPAVRMGSGCGIYLDKMTGKHYMLAPTGTVVYVYEMAVSDCAKKLRPKIKNGSTLSEKERERVEAYVLSHSIPALSSVKELPIARKPSEGLGYSWHFNWKGDTCDIIDVEEIFMPAYSCYGFRTTHYRLSFSQTNGVFTVVRSVQSGPHEWTVGKNSNPIAYPSWFAGVLIKAGNLPSGFATAAQSGSLYCFYARDELKIVTYSGTPAPREQSHESVPPQFGGDYYTSLVQGWLIDGTEGYCERRGSYTAYANTFTCGGVTVGGDAGARTGVRYEGVSGGRVQGAAEAWYGTSTTGSGYGEATYIWTVSADGNYSPSNTYASYAGPLSINPLNWWRWTQDATRSIETFTDVISATTLIVIPFMDAEAVYLYGTKTTSRTGTKASTTVHRDDHGIWWHWFDTQGNGPGQALQAWDVMGTYTHDGDTSESTERSQTTVQPATLVCSNGSFVAGTTPPLDPFFSSLSAVSQRWGTTSSINGVVHSTDTGILSGITSFPFFSAIVGWA